MLTEPVLLSIAATGFAVAFFHAALPTHWLPFVLAGRGQKWGREKTLAITALASLGHIAFTTLLGALVVLLGIKTKSWTGQVFPLITAVVLFCFGSYYFLRQHRGIEGHHHWRLPWMKHSHDHGHSHLPEDSAATGPGLHPFHALASSRTDKAVILGLLAMLTFSPCEGFLPVYLSGIKYGWPGFAFLSALLALATMAGMVFFTWLTMVGLERLQLKTLAKYESGILGVLLWALAVIVLIIE